LKKLFMLMLVALFAVGFVACNKDTTTEETTAVQTTAEEETTTQQETTTQAETTTAVQTTSVNVTPVLTGVSDITVVKGTTFDATVGVTAIDEEDGDISANVTYTGTFDLSTAGAYDLVYTVTDSDGAIVTVTRTVTVLAITLDTGVSGFYNYKFATTDLRHTFMAAAEKYLMNNMAAGVPLFANGGFVLYSPRLSLPTGVYMPVMGYGSSFGTFTADDSTVLMDDGELGEVGEYTYRTTVSTNPGTFNQWLYDTSTDSDLMGVYMDALYTYEYNDDKTGYELAPSMAASNPVAITPHTTETGKSVTTTWQITLRDDLEWFYHPNTVTTGFATGHETLDANDFVDTFELALTQEWFRAISGGGDFLNESTGIQGAQAYVDGLSDEGVPSVAFSTVGLEVISPLTFQMTFVNDMSEWNVRYFLGSFVMNPINIELYDALEADGDTTTSYGLDEESIAYCGPYYVDYYEEDKILRYEENTSYFDTDRYFFTGYTFSVIEDSAVRFQEFLAGKLESVSLPTEEYDTYKDYPGLKQVPGATTFRIMINGLGTVANQTAEFAGSTWVPEPILASVDFKQAMFFAVDRQKLAEEVLKTSTTNMYLFSDAYLVDAEMGIPYRETDQGLTVGLGLSPSTHGFNPTAASAYYELALDALVTAGTYADGTAASPTIITIEFNYFSGSEAQVTMFEYLQTTFEELFVSTEHYINVDLVGYAKDFPDIYYDYMMIGEFDLSIGGISGSTLDAASFLDTYCSDNRGGFTLNWGIDTSVAEIPVLYQDFNGDWFYEEWSFDAITSALNGKVYLTDGAEALVPNATVTGATATTVTFDIDQYENVLFGAITCSVQIYDAVADEYVELDGYQEMPLTDAKVTADALDEGIWTISGLTPYYYWYNSDGAVEYRSGDYKVDINYGITGDLTNRATTTTSWFPMDTIVYGSPTGEGYDEWLTWTESTDTPTSTSIDLVLDEDYAVTDIATIKVFDVADGFTEVTADFTISSFVANVVTIDGLLPGGNYLVEFTMTDDNWDTFRIKNPNIVSDDAAVVLEDDAAMIMVEINEDDVARTITDAGLYIWTAVYYSGDNPDTKDDPLTLTVDENVVEDGYLLMEYIEVVEGAYTLYGLIDMVGDDPDTTAVETDADYQVYGAIAKTGFSYQMGVMDADNPATEAVETDWAGTITVTGPMFVFSADSTWAYISGLAEGESYAVKYVFSDAFKDMVEFDGPAPVVEEAAE